MYGGDPSCLEQMRKWNLSAILWDGSATCVCECGWWCQGDWHTIVNEEVSNRNHILEAWKIMWEKEREWDFMWERKGECL